MSLFIFNCVLIAEATIICVSNNMEFKLKSINKSRTPYKEPRVCVLYKWMEMPVFLDEKTK